MNENRAADVLNVVGAKNSRNMEAKVRAIGQ